MKDRTKLALAKALQELLNTKTLDEVRVSELCNRCNLQRQSFYYHFQDKYDLVAWIFMQDTSRVFCRVRQPAESAVHFDHAEHVL